MINNFDSSEKLKEYFNKETFIYEKFDKDRVHETTLEIKEMLSFGVNEIIEQINLIDEPKLNAIDFPLMSSLYDATTNIVEVLDCVEYGLTYEDLGKILRGVSGNAMANYKYGESHSKVANMLGLVKIDNSVRPKIVCLSNVGYFYLINQDLREPLLTRLIISTPVMRCIISKANKGNLEISSLMYMLTPKTTNRRMSSLKLLYNRLINSSEYNFEIINRNVSFTQVEIKNVT